MQKLIRTFIFLTTLAFIGSSYAKSAVSSESSINMYGPGGPHIVLKKVAKLYYAKTGVNVSVNFGAEKNWAESANQNADILFGTSEQSALAITHNQKQMFNIANIKPLYLTSAVILVKKGNPKKITGLLDLTKPNTGIIVVDGSGISNTSGTGVWEDMIGRTGKISDMAEFRKNIITYAPNSGTARTKFINESSVDAWITWQGWGKDGEIVKIDKNLTIYRDFNIVMRNNASKSTIDFATFLNSKEAQKIFAQNGWYKQIKN